MKTEKVPGKSWYRMDLGGYTAAGDMRAAGYVDEFAGAPAATEPTAWIAEEKVGGRPADHYRGTVVLDELAAYSGPALEKGLRDGYVAEAKSRA
ncbi:hypothetical protein [Streptomyces sp. CB03238]|uniref:hypothetical protein n=1 Tax=Streptomyces sp. CB03238 TaxID=1907777 RepID=UPI000A0F5A2A|nr:hypothetical protein [Streptomyces sp. CB03238]ORT55582.1 hypothetical protein BKD26_31210 [Streptomyces sp. CB03238]